MTYHFNVVRPLAGSFWRETDHDQFVAEVLTFFCTIAPSVWSG